MTGTIPNGFEDATAAAANVTMLFTFACFTLFD